MSTTQSKSWEVFAKGLTDIRNLAACKICTRLMFEPYTVKCGHTFCYGCLSQWLNSGRGRRCPDCRAPVRDEPCPDFTIRNIVHVLVSNSSFLDDGDTVESLQEEQEEQAKVLEKDRTTPESKGLFGGRFQNQHTGPVLDPGDGVLRCPECNWELVGRYCQQCDEDVEGSSVASFSDDLSDTDYESLEDLSDIPDEEDRLFIDDAHMPAYDELAWGLMREQGVNHVRGPLANGSNRNTQRRRGSDRFTSPDGSADERSGIQISSTENSESSDVDENSDDSSSIDSSMGSATEGLTNEDSESDGGSHHTRESSSDEEPQRRGPTVWRGVPALSASRRIPRARFDLFARPENRATNATRQITHHPGRPNRSNVIDLTAEDGSSPAAARRRAHRASPAYNPTAGPSNTSRSSTSRTNRIQRESPPSNLVESDDESAHEIPIVMRPRKRERIVLEDSDDDEEEVVVQTETRSRRRRTAR